MINRIIRSIVYRTIAGKLFYQNFFKNMQELSYIGLYTTYSNGTNTSEASAIYEIFQKKNRNNKDLIIFDVGANIGNYSIDINDKFSQKTIYSFEPSINTYNNLVTNTKAIQNIKTFNFGMGETIGKMKLYNCSEQSGELASVYNKNDVSDNDFTVINMNTIDNFSTDNNIDIIDILKIDTEGHDFIVLNGCQKMIDDNKVFCIQFEYGPQNIYSRILLKDFFDKYHKKYDFYRIVKDGILPVNKYSISIENFQLTNYLMINKDM